MEIRIDVQQDPARGRKVVVATRLSDGASAMLAIEYVADFNEAERKIGEAVGALAVFLAKGLGRAGQVVEVASPDVAYDVVAANPLW